MNTIVLACGNGLRGDDGIAPYLAHRLYSAICDTEMEIVVSHQWLPEQAEDLSRAHIAVFIDASVGVPPGEVRVELVSSARESGGITTHVVTPARLMALARELFGEAPERAYLVTIGGHSFEPGGEFSDPVTKAIPIALQQLRDLLFAQPIQVG